MKINFKIPFSHKKYFKFTFIGIISIFIFLLLANIFLAQQDYFDTISTISIIIIIWLGCSLIIYLVEKKYSWSQFTLKRLLVELPAILIFSISFYILFEYVPKKIHNDPIVWPDIKLSALFTGIISVLVVAVAESSDLLSAWKSSIIKSKELEKENIEAQFHTLKSQINPHFLFNSLNTLANYVQENEQASEYLQNLSEYLRYTLVLNEDKLTTVSKELSITKRYIFLQKSRFKEGLNLSLEIADYVINNNGCIPPFSLQMLIENAIKHNIISKNKPLYIKIYTLNNDRIIISNNLQPKEAINSTQIGLKNIMDRYSLLSKNKPKIEKTNSEFTVSLPILYNEN